MSETIIINGTALRVDQSIVTEFIGISSGRLLRVSIDKLLRRLVSDGGSRQRRRFVSALTNFYGGSRQRRRFVSAFLRVDIVSRRYHMVSTAVAAASASVAPVGDVVLCFSVTYWQPVPIVSSCDESTCRRAVSAINASCPSMSTICWLRRRRQVSNLCC